MVSSSVGLPVLITDLGKKAERRFLEYFAARLSNENTRKAYARAWVRFASWTEAHGLAFETIDSVMAATYVESLRRELSAATVKQHLAALRVLSDWLVTGGALAVNPFAAVRGPRHVVKEGKTPVLFKEDAQKLLASFDTSHVIGLRDRAIVATMIYTFARVSAVVGLRVRDYNAKERQATLRLVEKGSQHRRVPVHHLLAVALDGYLEVAELRPRDPLFCSTRGNSRVLTRTALDRSNVWSMVRRRAKDAGLDPTQVCNHSFRATGITDYLANGGELEIAANLAGHASAQTTRLYNRNSERINQAEVEKIQI